MNSLLHDFTAGILRAPEPPCLSLYQPTHRHHPGTHQDPIRFRNLVKALEESLRRKYSERDLRPLLQPFQALAGDHQFWNHNLDGLAVLASPGVFQVYKLQRPLPELAVVAESFHIKPLIRILQSADRYHVLGVNRQQIRLFEGNRDALDELELDPAVPQTVTEVVGEEESKEDRLSVWPSAPGTGVHHSTASTAKLLDNETDRFFRAVDRAILKHYSRPLALPLILAALPENQSLFRQISRNPFIVADGVTTYPDALSLEALRERAWQIMEPHYLARLAGLTEMFGAARAKELGSDDLGLIGPNAVAGRVGTLLIEADRVVPGRIDTATGEIELGELGDPAVDDLLDDVAELVLKNSGEVVVVPAARMPVQSGIAAIYRF